MFVLTSLFLATPSERCCRGEGVPEECIKFCAHPGPVTKNDIPEACHRFLRLMVNCWNAEDGRVELEIIDLLPIKMKISISLSNDYHVYNYFRYKEEGNEEMYRIHINRC